MKGMKEVELVAGPNCGRLVTVPESVTTIEVLWTPTLCVLDGRQGSVDDPREPEVHVYRERDAGLVFMYAGRIDETRSEESR